MDFTSLSPVLSGGPAFVVLATVTALAVYMRTLSVSAGELIIKIKCGKIALYPYNWQYKSERQLPHTAAMLKKLSDRRRALQGLTPYMFGMVFLAVIRIFVETFLAWWQNRPWTKGDTPISQSGFA